MPIIFDEGTRDGLVTVDSEIRFGGFQQDGKTGPLMAHVFKLDDLHRWANTPEYRPIPICGAAIQARLNWMGMAVFGHLDVTCRACLKQVDGQS